MPPLLCVVLPDLFHRVRTFLRLDDAVFARRLIQAAIIIGLAWGALWIVRGLARRIARAAHEGTPGRVTELERRGRTLADLVRSVGATVVVLAAGLGVVGLAVSFGAYEALGESRVELRAWVNVVPGAHGDAERELRRRIKNRFDKEGIEIPVPQRVVRMIGGAETKAAP